MSVALRSLDGVKRPMKTFEADQKMFDLLEKVSALRTASTGKKVYESEIIRDLILAHAAEDTLRETARLVKQRIAASNGDAEEIKRQYDRRVRELIEICDYHGIKVDAKLRPKP